MSLRQGFLDGKALQGLLGRLPESHPYRILRVRTCIGSATDTIVRINRAQSLVRLIRA